MPSKFRNSSYTKKTLKNPIIIGTIILTLAGFISRILGFFYRIFLSNTIGAEGMGIYQLIFPVYGLCNAICTSSIQTAISRYVASELSQKSGKGAKTTLHAGLFCSLSLSILLALIVYQFAEPIAYYFLQEPRCASLLRIMAISLPVGAIHTSINGYYYGMQKTAVPAFSQLTEQLIRVFSVYALAAYAVSNSFYISPKIAVYGLLLGEAASVVYCLIAYSLSKNPLFHSNKPAPSFSLQLKRILLLAIPLSLNRFMLNLLQSLEAVLIPSRLKAFGLSGNTALEVFGVLSGMAMPFILFPSAITNSIAVMLLPAIADAQSSNNTAKIYRTSDYSIRFSLIIGILCTGIFLVFGNEMGNLFFHSPAAGSFITTLSWLCPFLYLTTTLGSILNGFAKTSTTFFHNLLSLIIRIAFVVLLIPQVGILGYLWGILASQLIISLLHLHTVHSLISISFDIISWVIRPVFCLSSSIVIVLFLFQKLSFPQLPELLILTIKLVFVLIGYIGLLIISKTNKGLQ